ncbi:MAG: adenylate/guanylate cyclase domain-containing protein [Myxococcales bacterium]|nr:adenylate/guanylate cyclase domain-containing protein [Myxococcales bacterium]
MSDGGFRLSIRLKAAVLLVAIAALPAAVVAERLTGINRGAVETSERHLQASVLAEVAASVLARVRAVEADARAVANALTLAAARPGVSEDALRSVVATRTSIDAVRFEVPSAKTDLLIKKQGGEALDAPHSTEETRRQADERGVSFVMTGPGTGAIVVPVAKADPAGSSGYVTVRADLTVLEAELRDLAETRFTGGEVTFLVADGARRAVAAHGDETLRSGADVASLPVWGVLPRGASWTTRVAVVSGFSAGSAAQVGGIESVEELGWAVALWRPERVAYATVFDMQRQSTWVLAFALLGALMAGFAAGERVTRPVLGIAQQAALIGQRRWGEVRVESKRNDELGDLSRSIGKMAKDLETSEAEIEKEAKLRGDLSRFMSKELVEAIVRGEHPLALGGTRSEISVLFADVVAFTPLAESRPAEEVVTLLNELFSMLSEVVFRHHGTVDKFIGDCIMAVWGAPVAQPDHARRALAAAEDMLRFLETANQGWKTQFGVELRLAIGVNSGEAIVGNIGSDKRMEYTVVGDVVNVAARLEAVAKPNQILVAERTAELAGDGFELRSLGPHQLTGRKTATTVYELGLDVTDG